MNTNNSVKWRRFVVPKKVEQINDDSFIDTYKSYNIHIGVNDTTVNDSPETTHFRELMSSVITAQSFLYTSGPTPTRNSGITFAHYIRALPSRICGVLFQPED